MDIAQKILLLDLCLPHDEREKHKDHFAEILTLSQLGGGLDNEVVKQIESMEVNNQVKDVKIDIISTPRFNLPSSFELTFEENTLLNTNMIELLAKTWFTVKGTISGILASSIIQKPKSTDDVHLDRALDTYWSTKADGFVKNTDETITFSILHTPFLKCYINTMTNHLKNKRIVSVQDMMKHEHTEKMKIVSSMNAGRVLYQMLHSVESPTNEHYFKETNMFVKYFYLEQQMTLTIKN